MKIYIFILTLLLSVACTVNKNRIEYGNNNDTHKRTLYIDNNDTVILIQDSSSITFYTKSYMRDKTIINSKANRGDIAYEIEYGVRLSNESEKKIEQDGGMLSVMQNCLSPQSFDIISQYRFLVFYNVTMSLDGKSVTGYNIEIRSKNLYKLKLTDKEISNLYHYLKQLTFVYSGNKFLEELVPVGWVFSIKKE